jgi:NADH-quinone oxidoreductase subunit A
MLELFAVFCVFGILGAVMLSMNRLLGPRKTNPVKQTPFECGSTPLQEGLKPFPVSYYLYVFLFILFDVEVVFLFPWALVFRHIGLPAFLALLSYAGVLALGFLYAWKKGIFELD